MADIELVVNIPEDLYKAYKGRPPMLGDAGMDMIAQAIANGTQIPKGHGDLIDRKVLMNTPYEKGGFVEWYDEIKYAPTIIEADTESEDKE